MPQLVFVVSLIPLCWLGMTAVHELGHVVGAIVTGGSVTKVVLNPVTISRTDVSPNPSPGIVVWAGPVIGSILPLALLLFWRGCGIGQHRKGFSSVKTFEYPLIRPDGHLLPLSGEKGLREPAAKHGDKSFTALGIGRSMVQFFAGFCLIANGAYISIGSFEGIGDAGEMLRTGTPVWLMLIFGAMTVPAGLFLWHRTGSFNAFINNPGCVTDCMACSIAAVLGLVLLVEFLLSPL